jgi:hypothetical protein
VFTETVSSGRNLETPCVSCVVIWRYGARKPDLSLGEGDAIAFA